MKEGKGEGMDGRQHGLYIPFQQHFALRALSSRRGASNDDVPDLIQEKEGQEKMLAGKGC
jgi:hypothetical protein